MTNKEFGKLQELILMFEKDFRGICRKSGRTCNDCSFSAGYEGCTLSQCSKAISSYYQSKYFPRRKRTV